MSRQHTPHRTLRKLSLAETDLDLTPAQRARRVFAQCDRIAYLEGFRVDDPEVEEPGAKGRRDSKLDAQRLSEAPTEPVFVRKSRCS